MILALSRSGHSNQYDAHWLVNPEIIRYFIETEVVWLGGIIILYLDGAVLTHGCELVSRVRLLNATHLEKKTKHTRRAGAAIQCQYSHHFIMRNANPPFNQIPHGSVFTGFDGAVSEPGDFSNP